MATISQYRPGYFEGYENLEAEFNNTKELLDIPWVANFSKIMYGERTPNFHRYSISQRGEGGAYLLIAEYKDGYKWLVVGYMSDITNLDLPEWEAKYEDD